mgnify:CR=1 FL=1
MRHKLAFILPRFAVVTLAAGLGALALFGVFKILLVVMAVAAVVLLVKAIAGLFAQGYHSRYHQFSYENPGPVPARKADTIVPVTTRSRPVIVPVG